jgi:hypothetical protein
MSGNDPDDPDLREIFRAAKDAGSDQARKQVLLDALRKIDPERAKRFSVTDTVERGDKGAAWWTLLLAAAVVCAAVWFAMR